MRENVFSRNMNYYGILISKYARLLRQLNIPFAGIFVILQHPQSQPMGYTAIMPSRHLLQFLREDIQSGVRVD